MIADLTRRAALERVSPHHYVQSMAARLGLFLGLLVLLTVGYTGREARAAAGDTFIVAAAIPAPCDDCKDCAGTMPCHSSTGACATTAHCTGLHPIGIIENGALAPYRSSDRRAPGTAIGPPGLAVKPPLHPPKTS